LKRPGMATYPEERPGLYRFDFNLTEPNLKTGTKGIKANPNVY